MRKAILFSAALGTVLAASSLSAQAAPDRRGLYADIGANWTFPTIEATNGITTVHQYQSNPGYVVGIGFGMKNNKLRLGAQVDYFAEKNIFGNASFDGKQWFYTAAATYYPGVKDMWVRLNLGYGTIEATGGGQSASAGGFAGGLGVGYDFLMGKGGFAIAPYASYLDLFKTGDFGGFLTGQGVTAKSGLFQLGVTLGYKH